MIIVIIGPLAQKIKFECDLGVLFAMATNQIFAKSSPKKMAKSKAKAKAKGKAKAKANPKEKSAPTKVKKELPKTPEKTPHQQMFNTFPARSDDPRAESLNAIYHGMAGNDPKKNGLVSQWKLDKTLSWHVHHEVHSSGKQAEQGQTIGWIPSWFFTFGFIDVLGNCMLFWGRASRVEYMSTTIWVAFVPIDCLFSPYQQNNTHSAKKIYRWQVADVMKMNVESNIFKEMLATLDSSSDRWIWKKPQEVFLAKKGEVKY